MPLDAVIFDHDGTLVDSERFHFLIWRDLLAEYAVVFTETEYIRYYSGIPTIANAETLTDVYQLEIRARNLAREKEIRTQRYFTDHGTLLMPNVESCLASCREKNLTLAIATGASRAEIERSLGHRKLFSLFAAIATGDEVTAGKPAPDIYQLAMRRLGLPAERCVAVEDSPTGVAAAKAAGLFCIAVPNHYSTHQSLAAADRIAAGLAEAADIIASLAAKD